jgi:hypothetical protein
MERTYPADISHTGDGDFGCRELPCTGRPDGWPEEIASLIVCWWSDLAGYITGNWIEVDGGVHRPPFE